MKTKKIKVICIVLCSIFILTMRLHFPCMASEEKKFDISVSMNGHDKDRLVVDAEVL